MLRRLCVVLTLGILMMVAVAQGAAADPIGAKNSFQFPATCDGQTVQLTVNGSGDFMPGLVVGSTTVLVVEAFDITFQFTPTGGEPMQRTAARSQENVHGDLVTCSFDFSQTSPEGTLRIFGTATGFFTPPS
jgi:hypothetical protein